MKKMTDEQIKEKSKDLWNWVTSNMVDPNHLPSIRKAQTNIFRKTL